MSLRVMHHTLCQRKPRQHLAPGRPLFTGHLISESTMVLKEESASREWGSNVFLFFLRVHPFLLISNTAYNTNYGTNRCTFSKLGERRKNGGREGGRKRWTSNYSNAKKVVQRDYNYLKAFPTISKSKSTGLSWPDEFKTQFRLFLHDFGQIL